MGQRMTTTRPVCSSCYNALVDYDDDLCPDCEDIQRGLGADALPRPVGMVECSVCGDEYTPDEIDADGFCPGCSRMYARLFDEDCDDLVW